MTGQADVRWIWMAVALVVVAVPVLTVLFNREVRALQQRVADLERRVGAPGPRAEPAPPDRAEPAPDREEPAPPDREEPAPPDREEPAPPDREDLLDLLRTLSALRPAEPEFVEEYYVEADRD